MRPFCTVDSHNIPVALTFFYSELSRWVWAKALRNELAVFVKTRNGTPMRKNKLKAGPSGMSRNTAYSLPGEWGGRECLLSVDVPLVKEIMREMGGDELLEFNTPEFRVRAEAAFRTLNVPDHDVRPKNAWDIFTAMMPLVFPDEE